MEYKPVDVNKIRRYSIKDRKNKVSIPKNAKIFRKGYSFADFISSLPNFLAVNDLKAIVDAIVKAYKNGRPVVLGMGAHPIKVGLSPFIIELMNKGILSAVATNGACIIHDFELSYIGETSEDVFQELSHGTFGMAIETGKLVNEAINEGVMKGKGIGESIGEFIDSAEFPFKDISIFRAGYKLSIPMTVHVAIGTDIIHMHPEAKGSLIGEGTMRDFKLFAGIISKLDGGVYINLGSAVILPEVFLKALTIARNLGYKVEEFTTVNMDIFQHYRPRENVLNRPTAIKGQKFFLTGHHEIMFPLLTAMVIERL